MQFSLTVLQLRFCGSSVLHWQPGTARKFRTSATCLEWKFSSQIATLPAIMPEPDLSDANTRWEDRD
jgi:hypothetical protein